MKNVLTLLGVLVLSIVIPLFVVNYVVSNTVTIESPHLIYDKPFINFSFPFIHTEYNIQMADEIGELDTVRAVDRVLQTAEKGDKVIFHLSGYGGEVESVYNIVNNIRNSKAFVIMKVEAPVYSGHAYLAVNGDQLEMSDQAFLMFHNSSEMNLDCSNVPNKNEMDRNQTNEEHCNIMKVNDMYLINKLLIESQVLTPNEKIALISGYDVYIQGDVVNQRLHINE